MLGFSIGKKIQQLEKKICLSYWNGEASWMIKYTYPNKWESRTWLRQKNTSVYITLEINMQLCNSIILQSWATQHRKVFNSIQFNCNVSAVDGTFFFRLLSMEMNVLEHANTHTLIFSYLFLFYLCFWFLIDSGSGVRR